MVPSVLCFFYRFIFLKLSLFQLSLLHLSQLLPILNLFMFASFLASVLCFCFYCPFYSYYLFYHPSLKAKEKSFFLLSAITKLEESDTYMLSNRKKLCDFALWCTNNNSVDFIYVLCQSKSWFDGKCFRRSQI